MLSGLAVLEERVRDVETDLQEVEKQQQEITYSQVREMHIHICRSVISFCNVSVRNGKVS